MPHSSSTRSALTWTATLPNIHFFNSLGRRLEVFEPKTPGVVLLYTCGPTVYDYVHIGNLRTFIFEDLLRRTFKLFGYRVNHVMNLTDVDDKTIKGALAAKLSLRDFTDRYCNSFFEDIDALAIERAEYYPRATDYIDSMIEMIEQLQLEGYAYQGIDGSVYFSIERYADYGRLAQLVRASPSSQTLHSRINNDEYDKEEIGDFVLWKAYESERDGPIFWPSPFGKGRPGWHIECSAMAKAILGDQIDLHTGGIDNLFPHHENEIAQSECCHHKPFARYWLHSDHLMVEGRKMSKSLGNFYTLRDLIAKSYDPMVVRYLMLQTHYRHSLNFTFEGLKAAARSLERLRDFHFRLFHEKVPTAAATALSASTLATGHRFLQGLADDLNLSEALAALFEWIAVMNRALDQSEATSGDLELAQHLLTDFDRVLAVIVPKVEAIPKDLEECLKERLEARKARNWALSDQLRDKIESAGYVIEDGPQGSRLKRKIE